MGKKKGFYWNNYGFLGSWKIEYREVWGNLYHILLSGYILHNYTTTSKPKSWHGYTVCVYSSRPFYLMYRLCNPCIQDTELFYHHKDLPCATCLNCYFSLSLSPSLFVRFKHIVDFFYHFIIFIPIYLCDALWSSPSIHNSWQFLIYSPSL